MKSNEREKIIGNGRKRSRCKKNGREIPNEKKKRVTREKKWERQRE